MTQNLINIRNILFQQVKNCPLSWHPLSCLWCPWLIYRRALNPPEDLTGNKEGKKKTPQKSNQTANNMWDHSKWHLQQSRIDDTIKALDEYEKHTQSLIFFVFLIQIELVILCNNRISAMSVEAWKKTPFRSMSILHIN